MNLYEIECLEHRILIDVIEIFTLILVACFFVGYMFGCLISLF